MYDVLDDGRMCESQSACVCHACVRIFAQPNLGLTLVTTLFTVYECVWSWYQHAAQRLSTYVRGAKYVRNRSAQSTHCTSRWAHADMCSHNDTRTVLQSILHSAQLAVHAAFTLSSRAHCTEYIVQSTQYKAFSTEYTAQNTQYRIVYRVHCSQHTPHSHSRANYIVLITRYRIHDTAYTAQST